MRDTCSSWEDGPPSDKDSCSPQAARSLLAEALHSSISASVTTVTGCLSHRGCCMPAFSSCMFEQPSAFRRRTVFEVDQAARLQETGSLPQSELSSKLDVVGLEPQSRKAVQRGSFRAHCLGNPDRTACMRLTTTCPSYSMPRHWT